MFIWDDKKSEANQAKHGLAFDAVEDFDWESAVILSDDRRDYGEQRERAFGFLTNKLYQRPDEPTR